MPRRYAENTSVAVEKSRAEVERILDRYGATAFRYTKMEGQAVIEFAAHARMIRFTLPLPKRASYSLSPQGRKRTATSADAAWEQACRSRWRALTLAVKAKLEAVESGIATFEEEFLAYIVLPSGSDANGGKTIGQLAGPQIEAAYKGEKKGLKLLEGPK